MQYGVITGGTKGIGKAIAIELLKKENATLFLNYLKDDKSALEVKNKLEKDFPGSKIHLIKCDLSKKENIYNFRSLIMNFTNSLDYLILNNGKTDRSSFENLSIDKWEEVLNSNLTVPVFLIKELLKYIKPGGNIIFTGSLMGVQPHSTSLSYGVTKSSVHALVKNLVKFLKPYGVRINAVAPGFINTDWQKQKPQYIKDKINQKTALNRFGMPEEVASCFAFILENHFINGAILSIDGGYCFE